MVGEWRTNPTSLPAAPDGWRVMQIDELCERVTSGGTPSRQRPEFYENGKFNWFKTGERKDCAPYSSDEKIIKDALESSSAKLFPPDTVLMAIYGDGTTITSLGILRREAATNQACCAMIPKSSIRDPLFLFYSLRNHREDFIRIASGGARRNLSGTLIRRFAFNTPPLAEQKAMAAVLVALDDKFMVHGPGVITGRSGVLGKVFFIHGDFWPLNTSLWVKEFKRVSPAYTFHLLRGLDLEMFNAGSAVPTLNRNHVHNLPVVVPPKPGLLKNWY